MPELPEVECVRRTLAPHLLGTRVRAVHVHRPDVCSGNPRILAGDTIAQLDRRGKQLAIIGSRGGVICVHLGMSGSLSVRNAQRPAAHEHVVWTLDNDRELVFRDPRRFGGIWAFASAAALYEHRWNDLGPDALSVTAPHLRRALAHSARPVKAALLDQTIIAGVGNIYSDEAMFRARIDPRAVCTKLLPHHWASIARALRTCLHHAITCGGSTVRDYVNGDGQAGSAQASHRVYGRGGLPCVRCGQTLRSGVVAQRTTVWCGTCQERVR